MTIDELSLMTTPVFLLRGTEQVSQGTGFFYLRDDATRKALFLVTNIHVLTGHGPLEGKSPLGDSIKFQFHLMGAAPGDTKEVVLPLFTKSHRPIWVESSVSGADMAIIPIPTTAAQGCHVQCVSAKWLISGRLRVRPTTTVTLVGYPYGYYDKTNALPVFKTGSVASEPWIDFEGKPLFLVDVAAFPGMSGSPVFAVSYGTFEDEDGNTSVGSARRFLGIYASMQMLTQQKYLEQLPHQTVTGAKLGITTQESLQIGHVWKANLVQATVDAFDIGKYEKEILADLP